MRERPLRLRCLFGMLVLGLFGVLGACAASAEQVRTPNGRAAPGSAVPLPAPRPAVGVLPGAITAHAPAASPVPPMRPGATNTALRPGATPTVAVRAVATSPAGSDPVPAVPAVGFAAWRGAFRARALSGGIRAEVFDRAFSGVRPNAEVRALDGRQSEFTRAIWDYLDRAVSDSRIATGRERARSMAPVLGRIESRYGVDRHIVLAIWGLESSFGRNFGTISVIESLATLAHQGRRAAWAEEQLLAALGILQAGDIAPARMVGSWAGAMGHTQFIPTSYLAHAVDFDADGRRDIWAPDAVDALASTANYMADAGWQTGQPAVIEVTLPAGFDVRLADGRTMQSAAAWRTMGVSGALAASDAVALLLPAGARGPAFAVYPNFRAIKRYNNATSYALAVAHLADRLRGAGPIRQAWPRGDRVLSRTEKTELQRRLTQLGYDTQGADGIIGPNSRAAVRRFQTDRRLVPDGYVSAALLAAVRAAGG